MGTSLLDESMGESAASIAFDRIADVDPRTRSRICGMVVRVRTRPAHFMPAVEVAIEDPSGTAYASWPGRRKITGIGLGRRLLIEGVASETARGPVFVNPSYRLLPDR